MCEANDNNKSKNTLLAALVPKAVVQARKPKRNDTAVATPKCADSMRLFCLDSGCVLPLMLFQKIGCKSTKFQRTLNNEH